MSSLCAWIGDVALGIKALSQSHGMVRPHTQAGGGHSHQLHCVEGWRPRLCLLFQLHLHHPTNKAALLERSVNEGLKIRDFDEGELRIQSKN